jgi:hypothetical protein
MKRTPEGRCCRQPQGDRREQPASVAYKNVIGSRRASWRVVTSIEQKGDPDKMTIIKTTRLGSRLNSLRSVTISWVSLKTPSSKTRLQKKILYYRWGWLPVPFRFEVGDTRKDSPGAALDAYQAAVACFDLPPTLLIRLGLALNFVFWDSNSQTGHQIAKQALNGLSSILWTKSLTKTHAHQQLLRITSHSVDFRPKAVTIALKVPWEGEVEAGLLTIVLRSVNLTNIAKSLHFKSTSITGQVRVHSRSMDGHWLNFMPSQIAKERRCWKAAAAQLTWIEYKMGGCSYLFLARWSSDQPFRTICIGWFCLYSLYGWCSSTGMPTGCFLSRWYFHVEHKVVFKVW